MHGACAVGIDVGGTNIKIALVASDGRVRSSRSIPTESEKGPQPALERILESIRALQHEAGIADGALRATGIASAGIVRDDLVVDAPNLRSWEGYPLAARLGDALASPVHLENDVNAMAWGEWRCGAGRGTRHLLCLTLGTGVGGGLILDGQLYRGSAGAAGEVGHVTLDPDGPECACGSRGCLERFIGAAHIVARARELARAATPPPAWSESPQLSPLRLSELAANHDAVAVRVLAETGFRLGVSLAGLVNVLNPERIVVGGGVARAGDAILEPARRALRERAMGLPASCVEIVPAALGNDAALVGAALLALES